MSWQTPSIGILITSRNNYDFMEKFWIPHILSLDIGDCKILNIDEDSNKEEIEKGKKLCNKYNIYYLSREERGMHHNVETAIKFFKEGIKYILWFQHDCWPIKNDFFYNFNELVEANKLESFGTIGFNGIAQNMFKNDGLHEELMDKVKNGERVLGVLSRSHLESVKTGDMYYCGIKVKNRINSPVPIELFSVPFACAVPCWYAIGVNTSLFMRYIDRDRPFHFFKCWDDIGFQFLKNNIYNITLPDYYIEHRPDLKVEVGLPRLSNKPVKKGDETYHSALGFHPKYWIECWGWDFENPSTFEKVKNKYKDTLKYQFYKLDTSKGPLRVFDI